MKLINKILKRKEIKEDNRTETKKRYQAELNEVGREQFNVLMKKGLNLPVAFF